MWTLVSGKITSLVSARNGNIAVTLALLILPLSLAAGLVVDYGAATDTRRSLQNALDAAVLAGASLGSQSDENVRTATAQRFFHANETDDASQSATANFSVSGNVVTGVANAESPTTLMRVVGIESVHLKISAKAVTVEEPLCLLAIDPEADSAIAISGSRAGIQATNCGIEANSTSPTAITNTSNTVSHADFVCAVGGASGHFNVTPQKCRAAVDPYSELPVPPISGCDQQNAKTSTGQAVYKPGVFCGGLAITGGDVEFAPGIYIIKDGDLDITANSIVTGKGVTFYFYGDAGLKFAGNASSQLTAPSSGSYEGLIFVQNPDAAPGRSSRITGTESTKLVGSGYFPTQILEIGGSGRFGIASSYMTFVAMKYRLFGNGQLHFSYNPNLAGFTSPPTAMRYISARLIE